MNREATERFRQRFATHRRNSAAILRTASDGWRRDDATLLAAAVAFFAAFSLAPLLVLLLSAAGTLFGAEDARTRVLALVTAAGSPRAARAVESLMIRAAATDDSGTNIVSVFVLVISASSVFRHLKRTLHLIFDVPIRKEKGWIRFARTRAFAVAVVVGTIFLLVIILAAGASLEWLRANTPEAVFADAALWRTTELLLSFVVLTVLFGAILRYVPDVRLPWRQTGWAAALAALVFVAGKFLIAQFVTRTRPASPYAGTGALTLVLIYVYFAAAVILAAAELAEVLARRDAAFVSMRERLQQRAGWLPRKPAGI
ncbi:MAG: YihY/virulence factor BrkB family protein [Acidobacteriota bacterium]